MSDIKIDDGHEVQDLDDLSGEQQVLLAMCAFLYMKKLKTITDEELLSNILNFFEVLTADVESFEPVDVPPSNGDLH